MHRWWRWERLGWLGCSDGLLLGRGAPAGEEEAEAEAVVHVTRAEKARRVGNTIAASLARLGHGGACSGMSRGEGERRGSGESEGETERGLGWLQIEARSGQRHVA